MAIMMVQWWVRDILIWKSGKHTIGYVWIHPFHTPLSPTCVSHPETGQRFTGSRIINLIFWRFVLETWPRNFADLHQDLSCLKRKILDRGENQKSKFFRPIDHFRCFFALDIFQARSDWMTDTGVFSYLHLHCSEKGQTFFWVTVYIMVSTPRGRWGFPPEYILLS